MKRFIIRIPIADGGHIDIEADTLEEAQQAEVQVRAQYGQKSAAQQAKAQEQPQAPNCDKCGTIMQLQQKTSKRTGKFYSAYFCPNSSAQDSHPLKFPN